MTHHEDAAYGRDIMLRWCALAEQRLRYLAELFETGRWRRLYSERAFLENVREAKRAVEVWRDLSTKGARSAVWTERPVPAAAPLPDNVPPQTVQPKSVQIAASVPLAILEALSNPLTPQAEPGPQAELVQQDEKHPKPPAATAPVVDFTPDRDSIKERYPLLRTTF